MAKGTVRSDSGRLSYGSGKPVLGRKFCSKCGKWRHLCDFHVDERTHGVAIRFKHMCKTCFRLYEREKYADPVYRERKREYQRIYLDARRRAAGVPARKFREQREIDTGSQLEKVPNEPLRRRFLELQAGEGLSAAKVADKLGWTYTAANRRYGDDRRVKRTLGLEPWSANKNGKGYTSIATHMSYANAVKLARVLKMEPHEAGV